MQRFKMRYSIIILAVLALLVFLHYTNILLPVENIFIKTIVPIQSRVYRFGNIFNNFTSLLKNEDISDLDLKKIYENNTELLIENQNFKNEVEKLKSLLLQYEFLAQTQEKYLVSHIIGEDIFHSMNVIIIDKGSNDGVVKDLPIIVENGILVGKVIDIEPALSRVLLITDNHSQIAATLSDSDKVVGIVSGEHGLTMKMDLIPKDQPLEINQLIITSGLEKNIPKGLIIGKVIRIDNEPNNFFQVAYLQTLINLNNIHTVSILLAQ